jgi:hypothetical protein
MPFRDREIEERKMNEKIDERMINNQSKLKSLSFIEYIE